MNKYLEKIASKTKNDPSWARTGIEAGAGGYLLKDLPSHTLGYHTIYHGTSKETANKIRKEGFDPSKGGTGAAGHSGQSHFQDESAGKIHFTKKKPLAKFFAGYTEAGQNLPPIKDPNLGHLRNYVHGIKNQVLGNKGEVFKTRVSDEDWINDFKRDPHMSSKEHGATTSKHIGTEHLNKPRSAFLTKKHLNSYYASKSGVMRAAKGLGKGALGVGLITHAVHARMNNDK